MTTRKEHAARPDVSSTLETVFTPLTPAEARELRNFGGPAPTDVVSVGHLGTARPGYRIPAPPVDLEDSEY